jgi:hypothetical protein
MSPELGILDAECLQHLETTQRPGKEPARRASSGETPAGYDRTENVHTSAEKRHRDRAWRATTERW